MEKRKLIWYWIITGLLSFCIFSGGCMQLIQVKGVVEGFKPLGYPTYFISIIGAWKIYSTNSGLRHFIFATLCKSNIYKDSCVQTSFFSVYLG
jgi:hypothetical protein